MLAYLYKLIFNNMTIWGKKQQKEAGSDLIIQLPRDDDASINLIETFFE